MTFFGGQSAEHLKQFIERIERLEEEKKTTAEYIKEVFAEAKGTGFDVKTMREIIKLRKKDYSDLEEAEYLLDTYKRAMGMLPQLDLFEEQKTSNMETILSDMSRATKDMVQLKKAGDNIRRIAKEQGFQQSHADQLIQEKALEASIKLHLPQAVVIAAMR